jgi:RNA polymerase sigma factor (sigma-70 family)
MIYDSRAKKPSSFDGSEQTKNTRTRTNPLSREAARWLIELKSDDEKVKAAFVSWLRESPRHFREYLRVSAEEFECAENAQKTANSDFSSVEAVAEPSELQNQLYLRYRRPLLQVFHHRRIDRDTADDLLQRTFLQAIKKIRTEGLDDPANLGGYLYRTACKLATAYWRGELSHRHENSPEVLLNLQDEALSLEERLDHELLAQHVRNLMDHLPVRRDREVLERFYLHEETPAAIRDSLRLTDMQFKQVLWRARQRFGEILRSSTVRGELSFNSDYSNFTGIR